MLCEAKTQNAGEFTYFVTHRSSCVYKCARPVVNLYDLIRWNVALHNKSTTAQIHWKAYMRLPISD